MMMIQCILPSMPYKEIGSICGYAGNGRRIPTIKMMKRAAARATSAVRGLRISFERQRRLNGDISLGHGHSCFAVDDDG